MNLASLTMTQAAQMLREQEISPVTLTNLYLERIEKFNPRLNCFITLTSQQALETASLQEMELRRGEGHGLVYGIPVALKDLFATKGVRTTAGSKVFQDYVPENDAYVVDKLKQAGAIFLGKTNMHEIALGVTNVNPHFGACHNPWDLDRISGGSSGGSAAAVAAGLCLGALGSDTGGSIRIPSSLCGVVGLKPTYGRVSLRGVIPLSWNLDHVGSLARRVQDAAILYQILAGYDPQDAYSQNIPVQNSLAQIEKGVKGWRIALAEGEFFASVEPEVRQAVFEAVKTFRSLGARVITVDLPDLQEAARLNGLMVTADAAAFHHSRLQTRPTDFGADVLQRLMAGAAVTSTEYALARQSQRLARLKLEYFFKDFDLLILPTTPCTAPFIEGPDAVEQARLLTRFTAPFNLTGLPAISMPCGFSTAGLPIGLQLIARPWAEAKILRAAFAYEQAAQWFLKTPC